MIKDPIVEEIRAIRKQLENQNGSNFAKYLEKVYAQERKNKSRVVSLSSKKHLTKKAA